MTPTKSSKTLKPATHLSHVLAWRGTPDRTNFAYAHDATITWSVKPPEGWLLKSYLNGECARTAPLMKGDFIWRAGGVADYLSAVNAGNTLEHVSRFSSQGDLFKWDGEKLVSATLKELLKHVE